MQQDNFFKFEVSFCSYGTSELSGNLIYRIKN